ncbi:MAG: sigma-70 family RNA polymerase sigma factor [Bacteroidota bacterium]
MAKNIRKITPIQNLTDEELVEKFAKTQKHAYFEELYKRYIHLSFGVCLKMMKNESDSRDVVSDVFKILYQKLPTAKVQSFKAYVYAVSRNECIAKLRQRKSEMKKREEWQRTEISHSEFMENEGLLALDNVGPSKEKLVEDAVANLGEDQRLCIRLFFYNNKSYKEIASQTGYTEKQVKSYLQNGKRNLRIALEKEMRKLSA